jgi:dihydroflavonol-4-reductase
MQMKVFCTGATGLVGAHTALALLAAGHETRLLVRNHEAARTWFEAHGQHIEDFVTVDIRDQTALEHAMAGCDAVFHAAAAVSLDPRRARETYDTNIGAAKAVLGAASALGIGNLLYVSSVMALFHPGPQVSTNRHRSPTCPRRTRAPSATARPTFANYNGGTCRYRSPIPLPSSVPTIPS